MGANLLPAVARPSAGHQAKLEAVESGIIELEEKFLAYNVLALGNTVGRWMLLRLRALVSRAKCPHCCQRRGHQMKEQQLMTCYSGVNNRAANYRLWPVKLSTAFLSPFSTRC
jgi:hypothetical protein